MTRRGQEPDTRPAPPGFGLPQRRPGGRRGRPARHRAGRAAAGRHLRTSPRRPWLRPRRLRRRLRPQDRHLPAGKDISVLDAMRPKGQGRDRGHLLRRRSAAPARPAASAPPAGDGSSRCCPATWPKPRPPPGPRKPRSASRLTTRAAPASKAPCTRPPATAHGAHATAAYRKPASTTSTWPARSTSSGCTPTGPAPRWTGSEPATWHASNSASPHKPELTTRVPDRLKTPVTRAAVAPPQIPDRDNAVVVHASQHPAGPARPPVLAMTSPGAPAEAAHDKPHRPPGRRTKPLSSVGPLPLHLTDRDTTLAPAAPETPRSAGTDGQAEPSPDAATATTATPARAIARARRCQACRPPIPSTRS